MNLPNKLSLIRILMVPIFMVVMMLPESIIPFWITSIIGFVLFLAAALTDMFDGKIARKRGLITDFGKFIDPLADKFMVIGAMLVILYRFAAIRPIFIWALIIVIFREFAVTSMRLVVSTTGGGVVAANMLGKIKTVTQIVFVCCAIGEPVIEWGIELLLPDYILHGIYPLTYLSMLVMTVFTLWSGINYIAAYWKFIDTEK